MDESRDERRRTLHALRAVVGRKWAPQVLDALAERERGFNDLRRALDGVTAKTLSNRLTELECRGFVEKEVRATSPPTTRYSLTSQGREAADLLGDLASMARLVDCGETECAVVWPAGAPPRPDCACECE